MTPLKNKYFLFPFTIIAGAVLGYAYWFYIGCSSGCVIGSYWYNSTIYGGLMGGLLTNFFTTKKRTL